MDALVTLRLRIGVDAMTESPLIDKPAELNSFIQETVKAAFEPFVKPGGGDDTVVLGARTEGVTVLSEGAPIGNRAGALLQHAGAVAMDFVADLVGVVCIPVWGITSDQLPRQWMFVRAGGSDPLVIKMQAAEAMSRILREQSDMYAQLIAGLHEELRKTSAQLADTKRELAAVAGIVASNQASENPSPPAT